MTKMIRLYALNAIALWLLISGCTSPKYVPKIEDLPNSTYGIAMQLRRHSDNSLIQGELLAIDSTQAILLTQEDDSLHVVEIPTRDIRMFKLRYAQQMKYGWSIPVYALAGVSHGWWGVFTIPFNMVITSAVTANGANAFTYNDKQVTIHEIQMFARFPQGIPPNVSYQMLEETRYRATSVYTSIDSLDNNGGFETLEDGIPVSWFLYNANNYKGINLLEVTKQNVFEGKNALSFSVPSVLKEEDKPAITQFVPVEPNAKYNIVFYALTKGLVLQLKAGDPSNEIGTIHSLETEANSDGWQAYLLRIKTGNDQRRLRIEINSLTNGHALVDEVEYIRTD
jgi:hypothetical protein